MGLGMQVLGGSRWCRCESDELLVLDLKEENVDDGLGFDGTDLGQLRESCITKWCV